MRKHKHHVVPQHRGGTDDETNLVELTIEEHAEEHRKLYELHGDWQDYVAWKGLLGLISKQEIVEIVLSESGRKGALVGNSRRKGLKYKWKKPPKPRGTGGLKWYHDPLNPVDKICISDGSQVPDGWIRGQGRKAVNPGLNFTAKAAEPF